MENKRIKVTKTEYLTTGDQKIDQYLNGGLPTSSLIHLYGKRNLSSSGKTQLGLQLSITAQLKKELGGLEKGNYSQIILNFCSVYINKEKKFPTERLLQLSEKYDTQLTQKQILNNIHIIYSPTIDLLKEIIMNKLREYLIEKKKENQQVGVVIIDNIQFILNNNNSSIDIVDYSDLYLIVQQLNILKEEFGLIVIMINNVNDVIDNNEKLNSSNLISLKYQINKINKLKIQPNFGLTFKNYISNQIILSRIKQNYKTRENNKQNKNENNEDNDSSIISNNSNLRILKTIGCRWCKDSELNYIITRDGLVYSESK
ncbi:P-loop containing nucleoside triphosphate hydrolase protein [Neoconidiobolus thromboides FSU 785]|nr:P-loop containing nucleoside triphosphate hydrolase protein [Neoconidiobolus thromboides FSU 785]